MHKIRHLGERYMIVTVLHDVVEDTDMTIYDLKAVGFDMEILLAIDYLDHSDQSIPYMDYIKNLSVNKIAREVKLRDLEHNSKITRLKGLREKDFERLTKYQKAYEFLKKIV